jgi:hypothetical protein
MANLIRTRRAAPSDMREKSGCRLVIDSGVFMMDGMSALSADMSVKRKAAGISRAAGRAPTRLGGD